MRLANGIIRVSFRREDFRVAFLPPFLLAATISLLLSECLFAFTGGHSRQVLLVVVPFLVVVFCSFAILLLRASSLFQVSRQGIDRFDLWHRTRHTDWDAVTDAQFVETIGLPYLKLCLRDSAQVIWLPMFVNNSQALRDLLALHLPDSISRERLR